LIQSTGAASLASLLPRAVFSQGAGNRKSRHRCRSGNRPELHSHFAEHLGSCVYGGIRVGKNSPVPNIKGFRRAAVDHLKELGVPVLRWPGGCVADVCNIAQMVNEQTLPDLSLSASRQVTSWW
jgi:alpha-N-arabinofuranosidase